MASQREKCPFCEALAIINIMHFKSECTANPEKDMRRAGELLLKFKDLKLKPVLPAQPQAQVLPQPLVRLDPLEEKRQKHLARNLNEAPKKRVGERELAENQLEGDHPPASHAVVDWEIPDEAAQTFNPLQVFYNGHVRTEGRFSFHSYRVGGFTVYVVWPKDWLPPAPNRFGWLPQRTFGRTEGLFDVQEQFLRANPMPQEVWYRAIDGRNLIRNFP